MRICPHCGCINESRIVVKGVRVLTDADGVQLTDDKGYVHIPDSQGIIADVDIPSAVVVIDVPTKKIIIQYRDRKGVAQSMGFTHLKNNPKAFNDFVVDLRRSLQDVAVAA